MKKRRKNKRKIDLLNFLFYTFLIGFICLLLTETPIIDSNKIDIFIYKIYNFLIGLSFIIPIVLIKKSPKKKKWWSSVFGFIVFLVMICSADVILSIHTNKNENKEETKEVTTKVTYIENVEDKSNLTENELEESFNELIDDNNNKNIEIPLSSKNITVHFIDVGQGDSIFIELPNNQTMLIDAAEANKSEIISNYIKNLNYSTIDYLVGTHPHSDHIGGLSNIINSFEIKYIYMPKAVSTSKTYENLLLTIANKGLKVKSAKAGLNILDTNDLKIDVIAPNSETYTNLNNYSAVIKIKYKNKTFLFTGDAETKSENEITENVKADVIKIGHHGSDTSSGESFVNKVKPEYAIISVGNNNKYDHPFNEIITRWENVGAKVYRTDLNGNIVVTSDGNTIEIKTSK